MPQHEFTAPARVNLIGEHTDYTGGFVLPMAIPFTTVATITSADENYTFHSSLFPEVRTLAVDDRTDAVGNWSDYAVGVLRQIQALDITPPPFTLTLRGNVPFGAGLSSSASVEVATATAILAHANVSLPLEEIALLSQRAENQYVHSPCGIMDQFVITAAKAGHALLLNTRTLDYEHLPMSHGALADTCIVVINSMVRHSVATGDYGIRRTQLEAGQSVLTARFPIRDLGDASLDQLLTCEADMSPESFRRCRHIISENTRTLAAKEAMLAGNAAALGTLMTAAHASERDDFECSCEEVDHLVATAIVESGCFGARLTGGGFGGCTVNLVDRKQADTFAATLTAAYKKAFNITPNIYICEPVDGAYTRNSIQVPNSEL